MICQFDTCTREASWIPHVCVQVKNHKQISVVKIMYPGSMACDQHKSNITLEYFFDHGGWVHIRKAFSEQRLEPNIAAGLKIELVPAGEILVTLPVEEKKT